MPTWWVISPHKCVELEVNSIIQLKRMTLLHLFLHTCRFPNVSMTLWYVLLRVVRKSVADLPFSYSLCKECGYLRMALHDSGMTHEMLDVGTVGSIQIL